MTDLYTNLFIRPFVINNVVYSMQKYILLYEKNKKVKNYKYVDKKKIQKNKVKIWVHFLAWTGLSIIQITN